MKKDQVAILIIFFISIALWLPLMVPGFYTVHDDQQIARLFLFDQSLRSGQFPVRWVDGLGFGFGYPLFVFYPPFVYMIGELFHLLGFGFIDSVKLVFFTGIFASGAAMYILMRELWGKLAGIVSALFYLLVPYRAIDVYVRGALAESFSFVWLPLILWSFYKLTKTNKVIYVYLSAIFLALLMITHNLIFLPFMLLLPIYLLFLIFHSPNKKLATSYQLLATILALGLSAFFWLPVLFEKKYTIVDQLLLVNLANYNIHFVYPTQLWNWPWGFGGSAAGLADGISFKIGKLHILVSVAAFLFAFIYLIKNRKSKLPATSYQLPVTIFILFLFSAFMTTFYSKPIWDLITPLAYLQFPWRFLTFTALFGSIASGAVIYFLRVPILKLIAAGSLIILLIIPNFKLFKPQSYRLDLKDEIATSRETINWYVSGSSFEYLPKGVELYRGPLDTSLAKIAKDDIPKQKIEITKGAAAIEGLKFSPSKVNFTIAAHESTEIKANIFNFPGWQVQIDNQKVPIDDNNRLKLITFAVPSGSHKVAINFKNTATRTVANLITTTTIIMILLAILRLKWRNFKNQTIV